tara:strand:+ start:757 stop:1215 length:459 start_codon:yes stop_codon:yes gene_type:complete
MEKIFATKNKETGLFVNFVGTNKTLSVTVSTLKMQEIDSWNSDESLIEFVDAAGSVKSPDNATWGTLFLNVRLNGQRTLVTQANFHQMPERIQKLFTESNLKANPELIGYTLDRSNPRTWTDPKTGELRSNGFYTRPMTSAEYALAYPKGEE